jgi:hypothetical protein
MKNDGLSELLHRADQSVEIPRVIGGELAQRVRSHANRRAHARIAVRAGAGVLASCAALVLVILRWYGPATPSSPRSPSRLSSEQVAEIRAELARLDSEATMHKKTAEALARKDANAMEAPSNAQDWAYAWAQAPARQRLDEARERAALILVRKAQRAEARGEDGATTMDDYEQAARLFPETPAGREAARHFNRT